MSSTHPGGEDTVNGAGSDDGATAVQQDAAADDATRPTSSSADRAALRTSLAERFAAARTVSEDPVVPRPDATVPNAAAATPLQQSGAPGGTGARPQPAPASTAAGRPAAASAQYGSGGQGPDRPAARPAGPRRVRLSLARIDPWSVMKLSFLLSIAVGIGIVIAAAGMWYLLDSMHVFADVEELLVTLDSENFLRLMDYVQFDRVISMAAIVAVVDVLLLTALSTLAAFLYNIVAALVGGLHLTFTDD